VEPSRPTVDQVNGRILKVLYLLHLAWISPQEVGYVKAQAKLKRLINRIAKIRRKRDKHEHTPS